jgi:hypothetical protein
VTAGARTCARRVHHIISHCPSQCNRSRVDRPLHSRVWRVAVAARHAARLRLSATAFERILCLGVKFNSGALSHKHEPHRRSLCRIRIFLNTKKHFIILKLVYAFLVNLNCKRHSCCIFNFFLGFKIWENSRVKKSSHF